LYASTYSIETSTVIFSFLILYWWKSAHLFNELIFEFDSRNTAFVVLIGWSSSIWNLCLRSAHFFGRLVARFVEVEVRCLCTWFGSNFLSRLFQDFHFSNFNDFKNNWFENFFQKFGTKPVNFFGDWSPPSAPESNFQILMYYFCEFKLQPFDLVD